MSHRPSRRRLLFGSAATLVIAACKPGAAIIGEDTGLGDSAEPAPEIAFDPEALPEDGTRFPLAVQAGAMRPTSALLATWTPQSGPVLLRVWQPVDDGVVALYVEEELEPDADGFFRVGVEGLPPGEWFHYAFFPVDGEGELIGRSLIGRFRTALADDALEPLTIAVSACNGGGNAPWPALQRTAELDVDVFCHLGDMAYNDGAESLEEYRASWREYLAGDGFRQAYANSGLYAVWDDHEFDNDWNPETMDPDQVEAAKRAFFEHVAAERHTDGTSWTSYRWGRTAEFFLLDCRSERKPSTRGDANAEYLSTAQLEWLVRAMADSPCHFKILLNSVPITNMPLVWDVASYDRWEGYGAQRAAFLAAIDEEAIDNVWILSGDFHVCFVSTLEPSPSTRSGRIHEIAVTGGNTNLLGDGLFGDQFPYGTSRPRAVTVRFDPEADEVEVSFIDPEDGSTDWAQTLSYA